MLFEKICGIIIYEKKLESVRRKAFMGISPRFKISKKHFIKFIAAKQMNSRTRDN